MIIHVKRISIECFPIKESHCAPSSEQWGWRTFVPSRQCSLAAHHQTVMVAYSYPDMGGDKHEVFV